MSSAEEDNIRRPRRSSHLHSQVASEDSDVSDTPHRNAESPAESGMGQFNGANDADLFESGSEREPERVSLFPWSALWPLRGPID